MNLLALTPAEFQTLALGWLAAISVVVGAVITGLLRYWPQIIELKTRFDSLHDRVDRQGARQNAQDATVAQVALSVPPPAQTAPPVPPANSPQ